MSGGARSTEIALEQATAGMTLAAALLDTHGGVLLPCDTALTDSTLAALRRRGVLRCMVWAGDDADADADDADTAAADAADAARLAREREQRMRRLARLFRHSGDDAGAALLLRVLRGYRARDRA